jgi:hypothetical protein
MVSVHTENIQSSSLARPSKIYPNFDFWFENKPSGNPGRSVQSLAETLFSQQLAIKRF